MIIVRTGSPYVPSVNSQRQMKKNNRTEHMIVLSCLFFQSASYPAPQTSNHNIFPCKTEQELNRSKTTELSLQIQPLCCTNTSSKSLI